MTPQDIYDQTQARYRANEWSKKAIPGSATNPWDGPDVDGGIPSWGAVHNPDAFVTWWGPVGPPFKTEIPVRR